jgi:hypothetical protein
MAPVARAIIAEKDASPNEQLDALEHAKEMAYAVSIDENKTFTVKNALAFCEYVQPTKEKLAATPALDLGDFHKMREGFNTLLELLILAKCSKLNSTTHVNKTKGEMLELIESQRALLEDADAIGNLAITDQTKFDTAAQLAEAIPAIEEAIDTALGTYNIGPEKSGRISPF